MKKPLPESYVRRMEELRKNGGIVDAPKDFAKMRTAADGVPAETLSEVKQAMKANRNAKPAIEEAMRQQRIKSLSPIGKITSGADDAYKAASKLGGIAKKLPFKKIMAVLGGPIAGAISTASDAMASDDLGNPNEMAEIEQMKREASQPRDPQLDAMKAKLAEMANKPLSPADMLQKDTTPMIKELGGPADINPKLANNLLGEQERPDYDSGLDPVKEIERRKRQFGY